MTWDSDLFEFKAQVVKALSHPLRLAICEYLLGVEKPRCVNDIAVHFGKPQSLVSRHLSVLQRMSFVDVERDGVYVKYRVRDRENVSILLKALSDFVVERVKIHSDMRRFSC